jgi:hypothetical protein
MYRGPPTLSKPRSSTFRLSGYVSSGTCAVIYIIKNTRKVLKVYFDIVNLINDLEGVPIYIVLGHIVIVLRVLYKTNLVTHFFVQEEAQ